MEKKGKKFLSAVNQMLIDNLAEEVCVPHFTRMVRGEKNWYRVGPGVKIAETHRDRKWSLRQNMPTIKLGYTWRQRRKILTIYRE